VPDLKILVVNTAKLYKFSITKYIVYSFVYDS